MDDLDDSIAALVGNELVSTSAVQQALGEKRKGGGSVPGKKPNTDRGMQDGERQLLMIIFLLIRCMMLLHLGVVTGCQKCCF